MSETMANAIMKDQAIDGTTKWRNDDQYQLMGGVLAWSFEVNNIKTLLNQEAGVEYIRLYLIHEPGTTQQTNLLAVSVLKDKSDYLSKKLFKAERLCKSGGYDTNCDNKSPLITGIKSDDITFDMAVNYTTTWRTHPQVSPLTEQSNKIKAWGFTAKSIVDLLKHWQQHQEEVGYIKFYIATNTHKANETTLVMIGARPDNTDLVAHDTDVFFDFADPCPTFCDMDSPLN
ncbi:MAG TPA: hypothetical protein DCS93_37900 [Microscillaceae bacterium]|nr:hypothetical protein [Microscillaceae bacterium]